MVPALTDILGDEDKAKEIVEAGKASMGNLTFSYCMSKLNTILILHVKLDIFSFHFFPRLQDRICLQLT